MKTLKKYIPFVLAAVMSMCVFTGCISGFIEDNLPKALSGCGLQIMRTGVRKLRISMHA